MARKGSLFLTAVAATLAIGVASPLAAQSSDGQGKAKPQVRVVTAPEYGTVYVVPAQPGTTRTKRPQVRTVVTPEGHTAYVVEEQPKDTRSPRQRCLDEEIAREGGSPSQLAINLNAASADPRNAGSGSGFHPRFGVSTRER